MQDAMIAKNVDAVSTWNYPLTLIAQKLGPVDIHGSAEMPLG
jgi:hypothetical protein